MSAADQLPGRIPWDEYTPAVGDLLKLVFAYNTAEYAIVRVTHDGYSTCEGGGRYIDYVCVDPHSWPQREEPLAVGEVGAILMGGDDGEDHVWRHSPAPDA